MRIFNPKYFNDFKESIASHNFKSGEILLFICEHDKNRHDFESLIKNFFKETNIQTEDKEFNVSKLGRKEAIESIKFGLSTKANYTCIDQEFKVVDRNKYSNGFITFFNNPDFYSIDTRIFKTDLDLNDFWEIGGSILIDDHKIGIFWVNDLYDKFEKST